MTKRKWRILFNAFPTYSPGFFRISFIPSIAFGVQSGGSIIYIEGEWLLWSVSAQYLGPNVH